MNLFKGQDVIKSGTFLYDGEVVCDIRIVYSPIRYGSGDHMDLPEIQNDVDVDTYYIQLGSTTERGVFKAGAGGHGSLSDAMEHARQLPGIGRTIKWNS